MENYPHAGPPSEGALSPSLASASSLSHKPSTSTTRSSVSASSSHLSQPTPTAPPPPPRIPIHIRIVPKDVWLRLHVTPTQTIGSIKSLALTRAKFPDHDPTLSHRFYQDAINASAQAKLGEVASKDKVIKYRSWAFPKAFVGGMPEGLGGMDAAKAAALVPKRRRRKEKVPHAPRSHRYAEGVSSGLPPGGSSSEADDSFSAHVTRQISSSTLGTSPPLTPLTDDSSELREISVRLDAGLITGNRDAKLEEDLARMRLNQWSDARRASDHTPTMDSSSRFDLSKPLRSKEAEGIYTQLSASDSFSPIASTSSVSSAELVTTADDVQWGTQAETSSTPPPPSASAARPRSRTVTAADIVRSPPQPPPPLPHTVSSPVRISSLPRPDRINQQERAGKMVAESSQRRENAVPLDLLDLLAGPPPDEEEGFSTIKQRSTALGLRNQPSDLSSAFSSDHISRKEDSTHPLASKFALISSTHGCEIEDWKTASSLLPYQLLELQWAIPTERVYIPPLQPFNEVCLEPFFEAWVYVFSSAKGKGKWKLHYLTVKGWRMDLYRKKPRAGEASLPLADLTYLLKGLEWVVALPSPVPPNASLPALESLPMASISLSSPNGTITLRCITGLDHESLHNLLLRAWLGEAEWRKKAIFRAVVAGRGGTVVKGGRGGGRNARCRTRLRPPGWAREWEDVDEWSSDSELEGIGEVEEVGQSRRGTVTQTSREREKVVVPNGLYAAMLGKSRGGVEMGTSASDQTSTSVEKGRRRSGSGSRPSTSGSSRSRSLASSGSATPLPPHPTRSQPQYQAR